MSKEASFDLLSGSSYSNTPLYASLLGLRQTFATHLGVPSNIPIISHNNTKVILRRESDVSYPYAYIVLNDFRVLRDQAPNKSIARRGNLIHTSEVTNSTIVKGYFFACEVNFELHWVHNQITDVIKYIEKLQILGAIDGFSFGVKVPNANEFIASVELPDGATSFPRAELDEPVDPSGIDVNTSMVLKTKIGLTRDVPKVNNEGIVTQTVSAHIPVL